jgi:hypothetical protein
LGACVTPYHRLVKLRIFPEPADHVYLAELQRVRKNGRRVPKHVEGKSIATVPGNLLQEGFKMSEVPLLLAGKLERTLFSRKRVDKTASSIIQ